METNNSAEVLKEAYRFPLLCRDDSNEKLFSGSQSKLADTLTPAALECDHFINLLVKKKVIHRRTSCFSIKPLLVSYV